MCDELGKLSVPLGEEKLGVGIVGVLVDDLLAKFLIQRLFLWILASKNSDVLAGFSGIPGGISTTFHEVVMVGILLDVGKQGVLPHFESHDINTCGRKGGGGLEG